MTGSLRNANHANIELSSAGFCQTVPVVRKSFIEAKRIHPILIEADALSLRYQEIPFDEHFDTVGV